MEEASGGGIMDEVSWMRHHGHIMEEAGEGIIEGGIMEGSIMEGSGRRLGGILGICDAFGKHPP